MSRQGIGRPSTRFLDAHPPGVGSTVVWCVFTAAVLAASLWWQSLDSPPWSAGPHARADEAAHRNAVCHLRKAPGLLAVGAGSPSVGG